MEKNLNWWMPVLKGAAFFALGILVINQPDESMQAILKTLGIALIFIGVALSTFSYYTKNKLEGYKNYLMMGVILLLAGLFIVFNPESSGRIIAIIFALAIGFSGVVNLLLSLNLKKWGSPFWSLTISVSIIELIIATIFIVNPQIAGLTLVTVLGVGMIIFGLLNVLIGVNLKRSKNYFIENNDENNSEL